MALFWTPVTILYLNHDNTMLQDGFSYLNRAFDWGCTVHKMCFFAQPLIWLRNLLFTRANVYSLNFWQLLLQISKHFYPKPSSTGVLSIYFWIDSKRFTWRASPCIHSTDADDYERYWKIPRLRIHRFSSQKYSVSRQISVLRRFCFSLHLSTRDST